MRIGLDLDNVISDYDGLMEEAIKNEDENTLKIGTVNPNGFWVSDIYGWSSHKLYTFLSNNMEKLTGQLKVKTGVKEVIDKLIEKNEIYIITHRYSPIYKTPYETTKKWLKDNDIKYTKLVVSSSYDKSKECLDNCIDIFIDDSYRNCICTIKNGIKTYMMSTKYNTRFYKDAGIPTIDKLSDLFQIIDEKKELILYNKKQ